MIILSGKQVQERIIERIKKDLNNISKTPKLIIFQVGDNAESGIYINQKKKFGESLSVIVEHIKLDENIKEEELLEKISQCNKDNSITGIIVQLPIPKHLNKRVILDSIEYSKDVDGLGSVQSGRLYIGENRFIMPATVRGIMSLIDFYDIPLDGKKICTVGRSLLVGKPLLLACLNKNATVTVCHSHTKGLENITRESDVLVVAVGKPNFINSKYVRDGQIVIDVGIHRIDGKICGDVDFGSVKDIVSAITPVPGGVGPLTVASLFQNLVDLSRIC